MNKGLLCLILLTAVSCTTRKQQVDNDLISVSIAPFGFFVEKTGGGDFKINIMVPEGADPHMYEPSSAQISALRKSSAYISNGYLDFELAWLEKFFSVNPVMKKLKLADSINLIKNEVDEDLPESSYADPHFWISPLSALKIASAVKSLLCELKPGNCENYEKNYLALKDSILKIHKKAEELFASYAGQPFLVFHHSLAYIARDYNLIQVAIEKEGKEPSPVWLKEVIDIGRKNQVRLVLVQMEMDTRNAKVVASESGAEVRTIRPLSSDWYSSVNEIINAIYDSFTGEGNKK
ncbi:MAG: metal ABC transporter solute-binding protein, Zn/Mn family [Bacteroidales bacterium]